MIRPLQRTYRRRNESESASEWGGASTTAYGFSPFSPLAWAKGLEAGSGDVTPCDSMFFLFPLPQSLFPLP
jgi:hypothetical protein